MFVSACLLLAIQELEATSIRKFHFLQEEHGQMEREAVMSRWVDELQVAEAMGARAVELLAAEQATTAERGLDATKVHLAEMRRHSRSAWRL